MVGIFSIASFALSAIAVVRGAAIPRQDTTVDSSTYDSKHLEPYDAYHPRYMVLSCELKHNTTFFADCCHPLLKTQSLAKDRKPYCDPSNPAASVSSSAAAATPTDDGDDCDDSGDEPTSSASSSAASSSPTPPPVNAAPEPPKESPPPAKVTSSSSSSSPASKPTPPPASSGSGQSFTGDGTWFTQGGVAGACGTVHSDNDLIVALDVAMYGNDGDKSQYCGKSVVITNVATGKQATAVVADACPTCDSSGSLDMSEALFKDLTGDLGIGLFKIKWQFA